ncbi:MAG: hypothetical protein L3J06_04180 [Cyclobacteriaceae bacterium]|nr:hypothetical protein [Cyclobacteriaceae bacterium]
MKNKINIFSGIGSIYNPQWGITFKVYFENIAINELYELTDGTVHVETIGAQAYIDSFEDDLDAQDSIPTDDETPEDTDTGTDIPQDTITINGIIDSVFVNPTTGDIIVITEDGTETTYEQEVNDETGEKETTLITDSQGNSWVVDGDGNVSGGNDNTQEIIDTGTVSDSTQVYITYGKQKYKDKDVIFFPFDSKKKITLKALVEKDTSKNNTFTWKGKGVTAKGEKAIVDLSKSTTTSANKIELTYGNTTISISINIIGAFFKRLPGGTNGQKNIYGYDEMDIANPDDDHVSVKTNGETFIQLNTSTRKLKGIFLKTDNDQIAEALIDGKNIKIIGKSQNKQQTIIRAYAVNDSSTTIAVNVYDKVVVNGNIYNVYLAGSPSTKVVGNINTSTVKTEANKYLKNLVANIENLNAGIQIPVAYDINGNGKLDFYKNSTQYELNIVYRELIRQNIYFNDIVQFKEGFTRNWLIMDSVKKGDTYVLVKNHPKNPANKGFNVNKSYGEYNLQLPNGTRSETFQIISFSGDTVFITTSSNKSNIKGFAFNHPKTSSLVTSHVIVSKDKTGGAAPKEGIKDVFSDDRPSLIAGSLPSSTVIAKRITHEIMHGQGLRDVNENTNIMHYNTTITIGKLPFRYMPLDPVVTGTDEIDTGTDAKPQNQWELIKGR